MFHWFCAAASLLSSIESDMTPREKKLTGISKLTYRELSALSSWIESRLEEKKATPTDKKGAAPCMQQSLNGGRFLGLSDNTFWEVDPEDIPIAQGWISAVEIHIEPNSDEQYSYTLTNSLTGSSIKSRKAEKSDLFSKLTQR